MKRIFIIAVFGILMLSCATTKITSNMSPDDRISVALKMYEKKDYLDAKTQFRIITLSHGGSTIAAKAQYYLALCHFRLKEYILAASEFERLLKVFPNSEYVDDAKYMLGMSYFKLSPKFSLDQEYTYKAITQFQEFMEDYYTSPLVGDVEKKLLEARSKLAHKVYAAASQYRRMGNFEAAIVYYNLTLERFYDSKYAPPAQFYLGECHRKLGEYKKSSEAFQLFLAKYKGHELAQQARLLLEKMTKRAEPDSDS
ncbi:outer membrane protein assembly factor BamD [candidate division KSB1 bacterium]|nr:outer membrane protein assembly factor BamD [candidate division KSB1 bacterium]